jgi:hypothetical protein
MISPVRRILAAAAAVTTLILATAASGIETTIIPGVGIGKVKLGMTAKQVKDVLGSDYAVNGAENIREKRHVEYGWDFSRWTVTFQQRGRTLRVVQVGTVVPRQKTSKRIGPGSTWRALVRAYPNGFCTLVPEPPGFPVEYLVPHKGGTQTIYILPYRHAPYTDPTRIPPRVVGEVRVRTPFKQLPEFGPDWGAHCKQGWRTSDQPVDG